MVRADRILRARGRPALVPGTVAWLCLGVLATPPAGAQDLAALGVRAGAGIDGGGDVVYEAQIDVVDLSGSPAVSVALRGFGEAFMSRTVRVSRARWDYEEMRVWGVGLTTELLFRRSPEHRGPYFMVGLGVSPLWYTWRLDSTSPSVGDPLPAGGSFLEEEGLTLGSFLSAGVGQRVHRSLHIRAQATEVLVPSTDLREDLVLIPLLTLTAGVRP